MGVALGHCALDLSKSSTGWAVWESGWEKPRYGHWQLGSEYTTNGGVYAKLHARLNDLWKLCHFENLYYEEPISPAHLQGGTTIQTIWLLCGLASHTESYGHARRCRIVKAVNVERWRKDFIGQVANSDAKADARRRKKTGEKRASARDTLKALTIARCRQLGFEPRKNDEADALGLLDYSLEIAGITPPWRAGEVLRPPLSLEDT